MAKKGSLFAWLVTYNVLSALGWSYVLAQIVIHMFNLDGQTASFTHAPPEGLLSSLYARIPIFTSQQNNVTFETLVPASLLPNYRNMVSSIDPVFFKRAATLYNRIYEPLTIVQNAAVLEIMYSIIGAVRSPIPTTVAQVFSRLYAIGLCTMFKGPRTHPVFLTMTLAWSTTEIIRYAFYACSLLNYEPYFLLWLRYTTFYVLYPLGAGSEAFLAFFTLPFGKHFIPQFRSMYHGLWTYSEYARAALFVIWWPGLYIMYTHMMAQRRKVFRKQTKTKMQ